MNKSLVYRTIATSSVAAIVLMALAPSAYAQFVSLPANTPGQTQPRNEVTEPQSSQTPLDILSTPFLVSTAPGDPSPRSVAGNFHSAVYANSIGGLDFVYQIELTTARNTSVTASNISNFSGFTTFAGYMTSQDIDGAGTDFTAGGKRPFAVQRPGDDFVAFAFNGNPFTNGQGGNSPGPLLGGDRSSLLIIRTDATAFNRFGNGTISAGLSAQAAVLAPEAVVILPETGSLTLAGLGCIVGAVGIARRRRR